MGWNCSFLGWSREFVVLNFLSCCAFPFHGPLARKKRLFLKTFFCLQMLLLLACVVFQHQVWAMWGKKKTQGTHLHIVLWVLSSLAGLPSFFCFPEFSYVCFIYNVQGRGLSFFFFLGVLSRREKYGEKSGSVLIDSFLKIIMSHIFLLFVVLNKSIS